MPKPKINPAWKTATYDIEFGDPDKRLFERTPQLAAQHRKSKTDLRKKKRSDYARDHLRD